MRLSKSIGAGPKQITIAFGETFSTRQSPINLHTSLTALDYVSPFGGIGIGSGEFASQLFFESFDAGLCAIVFIFSEGLRVRPSA